MATDLYYILGVPHDAKYDAIKRAYTDLAVLYHPSRHAPDGQARQAQRFRDVGQAFFILANHHSKGRYDRALREIKKMSNKTATDNPIPRNPSPVALEQMEDTINDILERSTTKFDEFEVYRQHVENEGAKARAPAGWSRQSSASGSSSPAKPRTPPPTRSNAIEFKSPQGTKPRPKALALPSSNELGSERQTALEGWARPSRKSRGSVAGQAPSPATLRAPLAQSIPRGQQSTWPRAARRLLHPTGRQSASSLQRAPHNQSAFAAPDHQEVQQPYLYPARPGHPRLKSKNPSYLSLTPGTAMSRDDIYLPRPGRDPPLEVPEDFSDSEPIVPTIRPGIYGRRVIRSDQPVELLEVHLRKVVTANGDVHFQKAQKHQHLEEDGRGRLRVENQEAEMMYSQLCQKPYLYNPIVCSKP